MTLAERHAVVARITVTGHVPPGPDQSPRDLVVVPNPSIQLGQTLGDLLISQRLGYGHGRTSVSGILYSSNDPSELTAFGSVLPCACLSRGGDQLMPWTSSQTDHCCLGRRYLSLPW